MRKCSINISDKDYTMVLNRETIKWLESNGFNIADIETKPYRTMLLLWTSGLLVEQGEITLREAEELMEKYQEEGGNVVEITTFLLEEYNSFINALADTKSKNKKKATITEI